MIVYHGSNQTVKNPQVKFSKNYLDFGKGFYVTSFKNQAEKWALRKASRYGGIPSVNVYGMADSFAGCNLLNFDNENEKWLDFVCSCRKGEELYKDYDIIIGNVADDDVFKTIDMYFRGIWDKSRTIEELHYYKMNDQICFVKQNILDKFLIFKDSYTVKTKDSK